MNSASILGFAPTPGSKIRRRSVYSGTRSMRVTLQSVDDRSKFRRMPTRTTTRSHADRREDRQATRQRLIRAGLEAVLEGGWAATGIDKVLGSVNVPKGSFYYYFESKDDFGFALLESYQAFYLKRLDRCFGEAADMQPGTLADRMEAFLGESIQGMKRFRWRRGCLVGALGQELGGLHATFRRRLDASLVQWEEILGAALQRAQARGEVNASLDPNRLARSFWASWEGAVLRARLSRSPDPMVHAVGNFLQLVQHQPES